MTRCCLARARRLALAGCGEKPEPAATGTGARPSRCGWCSTTSPTPTTRASTPRRRRGEYASARARRRHQAAAGPVRAAEAAAGRPRRPRHLLRARAAARPRQGRATSSAVGALVQKPLTSLMSLDGTDHERREDLAGKRVGTAGIPYQSAYLKTILAKAGRRPRARSRRPTSASTSCPRCSPSKVDATLGAFWNYEGVDLQRRGKKPEDPAHGEARRADLQRARVRRPQQDLDEDGASRSAASCRPPRAATSALEQDPEAGVDALLKADPGLDRGLQTAVVRRRCRSSSPPTTSSRSAGRSRPSGTPTARWMRRTSCSSSRRTRHGR